MTHRRVIPPGRDGDRDGDGGGGAAPDYRDDELLRLLEGARAVTDDEVFVVLGGADDLTAIRGGDDRLVLEYASDLELRELARGLLEGLGESFGAGPLRVRGRLRARPGRRLRARGRADLTVRGTPSHRPRPRFGRRTVGNAVERWTLAADAVLHVCARTRDGTARGGGAGSPLARRRAELRSGGMRR